MTKAMRNYNQYISYGISVGIHALLVVIFIFWTLDVNKTEEEYLTIGFGSIGNSPVPGKTTKRATRKKSPPKKEEKKVAVPKARNTQDNNVSSTVAKTKKKEVAKEEKEEEPDEFFQELAGLGLGLQIDWGGGGVRKIYSYFIPPYPQGVNKEIDLKLRFTILPDGTVGRIIPLIKADSRLESAAISALRKWRFEPIPSGKKRANQNVTIIFPFRLR